MMSPTNAYRVLALFGLALFAAAGCGTYRLQTSSAATSFVTSEIAKEGNPAPDLVLESLSGEKIHSSELRGHALLIHFWASWCQPCRAESRRIDAAASKYRSSGLEILAVTNESDRREIARFAREQNLSFRILLDPDSVVFDQYRVIGIPTSYFVDSTGIIRSIVHGPLTTADLEFELTKILKTTDSGE